jgi:beta-phosphoglucomutase family hydrolase
MTLAGSWSPPAGTRGLIFDCDGTLADTMPVHYRAWCHLLGPMGIVFGEERFYSLGGMPTAKIVKLLADESNVVVPDIEATVRTKEGMFLTLLDQVKPIAAVTEIAKQYRGRMPMAVASGGYRQIIELTLKHIAVDGWFDATVCAEDVTKHKPEPDVFLEAAKRLGVPAESCVVFEDTGIGLEAARRAGCHAVDVRPWYGR